MYESMIHFLEIASDYLKYQRFSTNPSGQALKENSPTKSSIEHEK
jgi:hypothetical protein